MSQPPIGAPRDRVEGPAKVTGRALYTPDVSMPDMLHAVVVPSTIARGRIVDLDETQAGAAAGVVAIMTHRNAPRVNQGKTSANDSLLFLLQDDRIEFDRQPVAVVIAQTSEEAMHGAQLIRVHYETEQPQTNFDAAPRYVPSDIFGEPATHRRGDPASAFAAAPAQISQTYRTPTEHHNPIETHGTVAQWNGDRLTLHDSSQWAFGVQRRVAKVFGIGAEQIRVIVPYVGGAFGSKGQPWSHVALAAMAAKLVQKPVKLLVTRPQMFGWVGHRPQTEQRVALGARRDGTLLSVRHDVLSETSVSDEFVEPCGVFSRDLYAVENYGMSHALPRLNISKPTYQRGPGESTGSFAMESAMDELAYELGMDPLELRLRNYSERQPDSGKPYSSKHLRQCYARAAERFDWRRRIARTALDDRWPHAGRTRHGDRFAQHSSHGRESAHSRQSKTEAWSSPAERSTGLRLADRVRALAAEILEVPFDRVRFEFGDTVFPRGSARRGIADIGKRRFGVWSRRPRRCETTRRARRHDSARRHCP